MGKAGLILASALLAWPAVAQTPPATPDDRIVAADPASIAALMRQKGFLAEVVADQAGDPRILTGFGGTKGNIWFQDCDEQGRNCEGIELQIGILMERKLTLEEVNAFNMESRFAFLTLDDEKDPLLRYELSLAKPGVSAAVLTDTLRMFEERARALMQMVVKRENAAP